MRLWITLHNSKHDVFSSARLLLKYIRLIDFSLLNWWIRFNKEWMMNFDLNIYELHADLLHQLVCRIMNEMFIRVSNCWMNKDYVEFQIES